MMKSLMWFGPPYSYSGYAQHNRAMLFELEKLGWNIRLFPTEKDIPSRLQNKNVLKSMLDTKGIYPNQTICINLVPPPAVPLYGAYNILFTTIESVTVHPGFFRRLSLYDEVWVPCKFNYDALIKAGYPRKKLMICPEGVYSDFWNQSAEPMPLFKSNKFTFLFNGDWSYRKGIDLMLEAWFKAFDEKDNVRLLLLSHYQGCDPIISKSKIYAEFNEIKRKLNIKSHAEIQFVFDYIDDDKSPNFYKCADVYFCPTRGEAWGLPIIQAMSCGIPCIVPAEGGQADFAKNENSFLIDTDHYDIMDDKVNLMVDFYKGQLFVNPSVKHSIQLLKYCYEYQDIVKIKGQFARDFVVKNFSWKNSALIAGRRLDHIYANWNKFVNNESLSLDKRMYQDPSEVHAFKPL